MSHDGRHARTTPTDRAHGRDGHEDRHGHGCGHTEPNTADADGMSPDVHHGVAPRVDRSKACSAYASAVVDRRPFCVTEPVTLTVVVTGRRRRGSFAWCVHAGRGPITAIRTYASYFGAGD